MFARGLEECASTDDWMAGSRSRAPEVHVRRASSWSTSLKWCSQGARRDAAVSQAAPDAWSSKVMLWSWRAWLAIRREGWSHLVNYCYEILSCSFKVRSHCTFVGFCQIGRSKHYQDLVVRHTYLHVNDDAQPKLYAGAWSTSVGVTLAEAWA